MSARKPKTAEQLAYAYTHRKVGSYCDQTIDAHLAGQRCGRAQMRREIAEKLQALLAEKRAEYLKSDYDPDRGYFMDGITASAAALKIKLKEPA